MAVTVVTHQAASRLRAANWHHVEFAMMRNLTVALQLMRDPSATRLVMRSMAVGNDLIARIAIDSLPVHPSRAK